MSAFFVGQRVKKVRGSLGVGVTARVAPEPGFVSRAPWVDMAVRLDDPVLTREGWAGAGEVVLTCTLEWEPILPSGHRPAELTVEELLPFLNERAAA